MSSYIHQFYRSHILQAFPLVSYTTFKILVHVSDILIGQSQCIQFFVLVTSILIGQSCQHTPHRFDDSTSCLLVVY